MRIWRYKFEARVYRFSSQTEHKKAGKTAKLASEDIRYAIRESRFSPVWVTWCYEKGIGVKFSLRIKPRDCLRIRTCTRRLGRSKARSHSAHLYIFGRVLGLDDSDKPRGRRCRRAGRAGRCIGKTQSRKHTDQLRKRGGVWCFGEVAW